MKNPEKYLFSVVLATMTGLSQAASIAITPLQGDVLLGELAQFELTADFTAALTTGGAVDLVFNEAPVPNQLPMPVVEYRSFAWDPNIPDDPSFRVTDPQDEGARVSIGFGNFDEISGHFTIGTISFTTVDIGSTTVSLEDSVKWGSFGFAVDYASQGVATVNVVPVPLPGAIWLLVSGLGLLNLHNIFRKRSLIQFLYRTPLYSFGKIVDA